MVISSNSKGIHLNFIYLSACVAGLKSSITVVSKPIFNPFDFMIRSNFFDLQQVKEGWDHSCEPIPNPKSSFPLIPKP